MGSCDPQPSPPVSAHPPLMSPWSPPRGSPPPSGNARAQHILALPCILTSPSQSPLTPRHLPRRSCSQHTTAPMLCLRAHRPASFTGSPARPSVSLGYQESAQAHGAPSARFPRAWLLRRLLCSRAGLSACLLGSRHPPPPVRIPSCGGEAVAACC